MKTEQIERIVNRGLDSLRNSLDVYWPAINENDMTERNLSIHVAHSFIQSNWGVYGEASFPKSADKRLDLLALHEETNTFVAAESKILPDGNRAMGLATDVERIKTFKPITDYFEPKAGFGLFLAATWSEEIKEWWIREEDHGSPPEGNMGAGWEALGKHLDRLGATCRARWLQDNDETTDKYHTQWALYAIIKLPL